MRERWKGLWKESSKVREIARRKSIRWHDWGLSVRAFDYHWLVICLFLESAGVTDFRITISCESMPLLALTKCLIKIVPPLVHWKSLVASRVDISVLVESMPLFVANSHYNEIRTLNRYHRLPISSLRWWPRSDIQFYPPWPCDDTGQWQNWSVKMLPVWRLTRWLYILSLAVWSFRYTRCFPYRKSRRFQDSSFDPSIAERTLVTPLWLIVVTLPCCCS